MYALLLKLIISGTENLYKTEPHLHIPGLLKSKLNNMDLYSTANDPQPQMILRLQMIPTMDCKWSSTASDPQSRPQMIRKEK